MEENKLRVKAHQVTGDNSILKRIFQDRKRTNILSGIEQSTISWLVKRIPSFISSDMLTFIGTAGSVIVLLGFILGTYISRDYLLLGPLGLAINWFGDSLDGRMAYYRNTPRKWYGFSLDIIMDWASTVLIGLGYLVYARNEYELIAFIFVALYGWAMIISQLRYKITDIYSIDAGIVGPTEIRIILAIIIILEVIFGHLIEYFATGICLVLFIINFLDTKKLLKLGDIRDNAEREAKQQKAR
ncbi:CDP-alcohol phosphatidyltransferase family protein [Pedobacter sp. N36a]|uniref:CDP-alcohol phosphatidyltransferase family protein n=1 Tax=Pedobacter sp. N36a TaxID=2767996 RepID=UPI001656F41C|nr:CDP-alcohol phosphatidyltransferase family protein [Pedobacter sp. N36a]MBC8987940.1 CDP-alcohol phosphatidyltransferase family protein [Pedobacter sp. N36a]